MNRRMRRRDFMRASAGASLSAIVASGLTKAPAAFAAPGGGEAAAGGAGSLAPYVGMGSNAKIQPFTLDSVALNTGLLKEKQDRMLSFFRGYDERKFLVLFNQLAKRPNPAGVSAPGGWEDGGLLSGHWVGHYLSALAQAAAAGYTDLRDKLEWVVSELGECQDAMADQGMTVHAGYLGCKPEDTVIRVGPPRFAVYGSNQRHELLGVLVRAAQDPARHARRVHAGGPDRAYEIAGKMADWAYDAIFARRRRAPQLRRPAHAPRPELHVGHLHRGRERRDQRGLRRDRRAHR